MSKTKVALVGCGRIGSTHLQALKTIEEVEIAAVADESAQAGENFAKSAGCPSFTDYREMIDKVQPEVVTVCTPPVSHPEIAIHAMEHGSHVLCEKPFAIHSICAPKMVETAEKTGRYLTMASMSGGGVLIDNGSHAVDIIRYLLGPVGRVQAQHGRSIQNLAVEDTSMVF